MHLQMPTIDGIAAMIAIVTIRSEFPSARDHRILVSDGRARWSVAGALMATAEQEAGSARREARVGQQSHDLDKTHRAREPAVAPPHIRIVVQAKAQDVASAG
jgi:hypothetical protein